MDFSLENLGDSTYRKYESGKNSNLQLLFLPSGVNPELWRHQLKYFSREYHVESFGIREDHVASREHQVAEDIVEDMRNVVLVSHTLGNPILEQLESREEVVATVSSGCYSFSRIPEFMYRYLGKAIFSQPKLLKKAFFSPLTDYRVVKEFAREIKLPSHEEMETFRELDNSTPVKRSLMIHAANDRYSSRDCARNRTEESSTSILHGAGTFSFYEKPQEFNKALHDFLKNLEGFVEKREVFRAKKKNRSLKEFENPEKEKVIL